MKTKNRTVIAASVAALVLSAPLSSWAKENKSAPPAPVASVAPSSVSQTKSRRSIPYHGKISAVDQTAKTFSIPGLEKIRVFTITDTTVITKDGNPGTLADVVEDEDVRGSYWKRADGSLEARSVKLGQKAEGESKSKKKKKDKADSEPSPKP
jgi:hypothetical protein